MERGFIRVLRGGRLRLLLLNHLPRTPEGSGHAGVERDRPARRLYGDATYPPREPWNGLQNGTTPCPAQNACLDSIPPPKPQNACPTRPLCCRISSSSRTAGRSFFAPPSWPSQQGAEGGTQQGPVGVYCPLPHTTSTLYGELWFPCCPDGSKLGRVTSHWSVTGGPVPHVEKSDPPRQTRIRER